jgi:hypothetical protein
MNQNALDVLVTEKRNTSEELYLSVLTKEDKLQRAREMVKAVKNGKDGANLTFPNGLTMSKSKVTGNNVGFVKTLVRYFKDDKPFGRSYVVRDFYRV